MIGDEQSMNCCDVSLAGAALKALGSGALWWPAEGLLCVSDLHLGKSGRIARRGGAALPPYETQDTLTRLSRDLDATGAHTVICLGDSFDDTAAAAELPALERDWIFRLQAGRRWIWIEGNHDPDPTGLGGTHLAEVTVPPLRFRHVADPSARAEISGHFHPKARVSMRGRAITRPAFLADGDRIILPAYGTFTGGLHSRSGPLDRLMRPDACAVLTGANPIRIPMPR